MRTFRTLLWLEHRRSWVWAVSLLTSLIFWAWGIKQVLVSDIAARVGIRSSLLGAAAAIGLLVLAIMIGRLRAETRNGQYQVMLLSPPSGYTHILARFTYASVVAAVYFVAIGFLYWWIAELAGIHFDAVTLIELILGLPFFGMAMVVFPMLAWVLLLMVVVSSYRLAGSGWIPGTVMVFGSGVALGKLGEIMARVAYALPGWRIFRHALGAVVERFGPIDPDVSMEMSQVIYQGLPIEPMLIMLAVTALMIFLAGRIWQEVEA